MRIRKSKSGERVVADPIKEPVEFIKAPLGRPVSEAMEDYLAEASENLGMAISICEKHPWVLSKGDKAMLDVLWMQLDTISVRRKKK